MSVKDGPLYLIPFELMGSIRVNDPQDSLKLPVEEYTSAQTDPVHHIEDLHGENGPPF